MVAVVVADTQFIEKVVADLCAVGLDIVEILNILGLGNGFAVDIDDALLDLQGFARQAQTALHVVVAAVNRAVDDVAKDVFIAVNRFTAMTHAQGVVILAAAILQCHGVAGREVKHHDVHALHVAQAFQAVVLQLRFVDVGLAVEDGKGVLSQREVQRRLRHAGTVGHLVYPQEVAG